MSAVTNRPHRKARNVTPSLPPELIDRLSRMNRLGVELLADYGTDYFNPLLSADVHETFENIASVMQVLDYLINSDNQLYELQPGIGLVAQTVWLAAQYEAYSRKNAEPGEEARP